MYRVFFVLSGGLLLAACSSSSSWLNLDSLKPEPITENVQFESEPPGADAKLSSGQTCKTPCSISLPANAPFTVTFTLNGYQPDTEQVELVAMGDGTNHLQPNPVLAELTAMAPAPKKPAPKKPAPKKKTSSAAPAAKPAAQAAAKPAAQATAKPAAQATAKPAATTAAAPASTSPWPAPPPPQQQ